MSSSAGHQFQRTAVLKASEYGQEVFLPFIPEESLCIGKAVVIHIGQPVELRAEAGPVDLSFAELDHPVEVVFKTAQEKFILEHG